MLSVSNKFCWRKGHFIFHRQTGIFFLSVCEIRLIIVLENTKANQWMGDRIFSIMSLFSPLPRWDTVMEQNPDHTVWENEDMPLQLWTFDIPVIPFY